jgi:hypothetical protein
LESEFGLQKTIQSLAVLTAIGVVDAIVRAHDGGTAGQNSILERPEVQLVHGLVINVGRDCRDIHAVFHSRVSICLLFIQNVMLYEESVAEPEIGGGD